MRLFASVLLTSSVSAYEINRRPFSAATDCDAYNQYSKDAVGFLKAWNDEAQALFNEESKASWEQATNITDANGEAEKEAAKKSAAWTETIGNCAISFFGALVKTCELDMNSISCSLTDEVCNDCGDNVEFGKQSWTKVKQLRGLKMLQDLGTAILGADSEDFKTLQDSLSNMGTVYSSTKVKDQNSDRQHPLDPDLTAILIDQSTGAGPQCAYEKQKYYWDQWNTHVGTKCIDDYETFVTMGNKAAEDNGYDDMGDSWRSNYEDPEFQKHLEEIWTGTSEKRGVKDLYELVHGYIRWKLNERYGDERVSKNNDPIPDHIFGNMWAQTWGALYDVAAPYPDAGDRPDATPEIQKMEVETMFDYSDEFFRSLGMTPMTKNFWRNSVLEKRTDVENMVCHASAWDFMMGDGNHDDGAMGDYRIKMCTVKNQDDFITIHHEMGHIQYYQQYAHHPIMFRSGANPGFHEAIGDTLALAVSTPKHLQEVGLLGDDIPESDEADMNYLMSILLDKITFLPFGYLMDLYRWEIFEGSVKKEDYQKRWDELRREYQGIMPPNDRTFTDAFDAAGKYHIPNNTPYIRYFVSFIVQFQFYEKMCIEAGEFNPEDPNSEPLYKCDFFNSIEAGNALESVLQQGASQPWQDTMKAFLCDDGDANCEGEMDPESLLKYFAPIEEWLLTNQKENGWVIGWDKDSEWKPCGYSEATPCMMDEKCSTDEDWDPSWGPSDETGSPKSCQEIASTGTNPDGLYWIRPSADVEAFQVTCKFNGNTGTTIITHDHPDFGWSSIPTQGGGCTEAGCYEDKIIYDASIEQIVTLIDISENCGQKMVNNCTNNPLTNVAWWSDRHGSTHQYWHGDHSGDTQGCYCHLENNECLNHHVKNNLCNCDDISEGAIDEGVLSSRSQLPVTQLNYGDSGGRYSWVFYQLGYLECSGQQ